MEPISITKLQGLCSQRKILWTEHVLERLREREIKRDDVKNCIMTGEIIESYLDDYPGQSCLILGINRNNQYLHVVCCINKTEICIITAYYPNNIKWEKDFKTRKAVK